MTVGDLCTVDGHVELDGLLHGPGTNYWLKYWAPWGGTEVRSNNVPTLTGDMPGLDTLAGRLMPFGFQIAGSSPADMLANLQLLTLAWEPGPDTQIAWHTAGTTWLRYGRKIGAVPTDAFEYPTECRFFATDALTYTAAEGTDDGSTATVVPGGIRPTLAWRMVVEGPCTHPTLTYTAAGGTGHVTFPTLVLASGETLEVDAHAGTGLVNGPDDPRWLTPMNLAGRPAVFLPLDPTSATFTFTRTSGATDATWFWRACS